MFIHAYVKRAGAIFDLTPGACDAYLADSGEPNGKKNVAGKIPGAPGFTEDERRCLDLDPRNGQRRNVGICHFRKIAHTIDPRDRDHAGHGLAPSRSRCEHCHVGARHGWKSRPPWVCSFPARGTCPCLTSTLSLSKRTVPLPLLFIRSRIGNGHPQLVSRGVADQQACGRAGWLASTPLPRPTAGS
jgi:hypothetical protein